MSSSVPQIPAEYQDSFQKAQAADESQILAAFKDCPIPSAEVANDVVKNFGLNTPGPFKAANTIASLQPKPAQTYDEPAFSTQADQASITPSGPAVESVPYFSQASIDAVTVSTTTQVPANIGPAVSELIRTVESIASSPKLAVQLAEQGEAIDQSAVKEFVDQLKGRTVQLPTLHNPAVELDFEGPAEQLSVDDSFELLFDLVADLSGRLQSLEDRITLHNVRSSHKI